MKPGRTARKLQSATVEVGDHRETHARIDYVIANHGDSGVQTILGRDLGRFVELLRTKFGIRYVSVVPATNRKPRSRVRQSGSPAGNWAERVSLVGVPVPSRSSS